MRTAGKTIIPIIVTGIWINISETLRWIFLIQPYWIEKYSDLGVIFPEETLNMIVWMIWGFLYGSAIFILSRKFNLIQTTLLSWFIAFVMLWVVLWNVGVLPVRMLWINIPLSFLETIIAAFICTRFFKSDAAGG